MITALTLDEAIAEGFKYCNIEEDEEGANLTKLEDILSGKQLWDVRETDFYLCEKEPRKHTVSEKQIEELIQDNIDCQEDYYMEDGFDTALDGCYDLIKQLCDKINTNMSKHSFWFTTGIRLLPNPPQEQKNTLNNLALGE